LASCLEEQGEPPNIEPPVEVKPAEAPDAGVIEAAVTATIAEEADEQEELEPDPASGACAAKAPWTAAPRCAHDGYVYGVGSVDNVRDLSLARTGAAMRARTNVLGKSGGNLSQGEVLDFVRCGKTAFALARAPLGKGVEKEKRACDVKQMAQRAPAAAGCPAWTNTVARREGDSIVVVGVARVKNSALAEAAATNRARAEAARMSSVKIEKKDDGHKHHAHAHPSEQGLAELGKKKTNCGGNTFVELTIKVMD
jgi:hypothetical protein